ncbi:uncharacterized [Tachysurus ichikawai]
MTGGWKGMELSDVEGMLAVACLMCQAATKDNRLRSYFQPVCQSRCLQSHPDPCLISEGITDFRGNLRHAILAWLAEEVERDNPGSIASD